MKILFHKSSTEGWIVLGGKQKKVLGWIKRDPTMMRRYVWKQDIDVALPVTIMIRIADFIASHNP